jgi:hypothetical protein
VSRKTKETRQGLSAAQRLALRKRRWLLAVHILFQVCVVVGSQGPWYTALHGDKELWTVSGPEFSARAEAKPEPKPLDGVEGARLLNTSREPAPEPEPGFFETPGRLSFLALFAAIGAFFFASFNLVADADFQWPTLICSALVCLAAGLAFHGIYSPQSTLSDVISEVESARVAGAGGDPASTAPVTSDALEQPSLLDRLPRLRLGWGVSLLLAAAPLMLLVSVYLTFFAARTPERP